MSMVVFNPVKCIQERERGSGIHYLMTPFHTWKTGRRHYWKSFMKGRKFCNSEIHHFQLSV
jgi:hypothetical protein